MRFFYVNAIARFLYPLETDYVRFFGVIQIVQSDRYETDGQSSATRLFLSASLSPSDSRDPEGHAQPPSAPLFAYLENAVSSSRTHASHHHPSRISESVNRPRWRRQWRRRRSRFADGYLMCCSRKSTIVDDVGSARRVSAIVVVSEISTSRRIPSALSVRRASRLVDPWIHGSHKLHDRSRLSAISVIAYIISPPARIKSSSIDQRVYLVCTRRFCFLSELIVRIRNIGTLKKKSAENENGRSHRNLPFLRSALLLF